MMEVIMIMLLEYWGNGAGLRAGTWDPKPPLVWGTASLLGEVWPSRQNLYLERCPQVTAVIQATVGIGGPAWGAGPDGGRAGSWGGSNVRMGQRP